MGSWYHDIAPARALGIKSVWLDRTGTGEDASTPKGITKAEAEISAYARERRFVAVMANYASATGGYPMAGRSAIWDESGSIIAQAGATGESLVLAKAMLSGSLAIEVDDNFLPIITDGDTLAVRQFFGCALPPRVSRTEPERLVIVS